MNETVKLERDTAFRLLGSVIPLSKELKSEVLTRYCECGLGKKDKKFQPADPNTKSIIS